MLKTAPNIKSALHVVHILLGKAFKFLSAASSASPSAQCLVVRIPAIEIVAHSALSVFNQSFVRRGSYDLFFSIVLFPDNWLLAITACTRTGFEFKAPKLTEDFNDRMAFPKNRAKRKDLAVDELGEEPIRSLQFADAFSFVEVDHCFIEALLKNRC